MFSTLEQFIISCLYRTHVFMSFRITVFHMCSQEKCLTLKMVLIYSIEFQHSLIYKSATHILTHNQIQVTLVICGRQVLSFGTDNTELADKKSNFYYQAVILEYFCYCELENPRIKRPTCNYILNIFISLNCFQLHSARPPIVSD